MSEVIILYLEAVFILYRPSVAVRGPHIIHAYQELKPAGRLSTPSPPPSALKPHQPLWNTSSVPGTVCLERAEDPDRSELSVCRMPGGYGGRAGGRGAPAGAAPGAGQPCLGAGAGPPLGLPALGCELSDQVQEELLNTQVIQELT